MKVLRTIPKFNKTKQFIFAILQLSLASQSLCFAGQEQLYTLVTSRKWLGPICLPRAVG